VLLIRALFDQGATAASASLEKHIPPGIETTTHVYDPADPDAVLDIHRGPDPVPGAPVVVWVHGGGFVSGRRQDVENYLKVLAGQGLTVVNVDYTIAPEATYPTPIRQVSAALAFLSREAATLGLDAPRFALAGDSAGAQIAAQTAAVITNPDYAARIGVEPGLDAGRLAGALLFCGIYDITGMGKSGGFFGWFIHQTAWSYSGQRDWRNSADFATMAIPPYLTPAFPPTFITVGNADPLGPQSVALAEALTAKGTSVTTLFFPPDHPPLGHEYQFDLDSEAGKQALEQAVEWLRTL
jgi:acetyl esterase/lipase